MNDNEYASTYNGDRTEDVGQVVGPNNFGFFFMATSAEYDQLNNKTRLIFSPLSKEESAGLLKSEGWVA
ncbi:hypothetical protein CH296_00490 [Rhodococcus sp. 14-2496-1d]|uniref:hypothetical protein n=1 Tax=Rhodococcus sp. 14-2496-1d TaxID=2023146 RepID=UPI000B9B17D1|nr:hypothetical protein [Rhodococcus sp. 14-2496-1d]OZF40768.1 hypothetical protein CH296_00490 [Rhodococcus sp. 14-2496-1d]